MATPTTTSQAATRGSNKFEPSDNFFEVREEELGWTTVYEIAKKFNGWRQVPPNVYRSHGHKYSDEEMYGYLGRDIERDGPLTENLQWVTADGESLKEYTLNHGWKEGQGPPLDKWKEVAKDKGYWRELKMTRNRRFVSAYIAICVLTKTQCTW